MIEWLKGRWPENKIKKENEIEKNNVKYNNYFRGKEWLPTSSMVSEQLNKMKGSTDKCL